MVNIDVRTVAAGRDYRARITHSGRDRVDGSYRLMLTNDGMVQIFTADKSLGLYRLDRFGDSLSPATVRQFFLTSLAASAGVDA